MSKDSSKTNSLGQYAIVKWSAWRGIWAVALSYAGGQFGVLVLFVLMGFWFGDVKSITDWAQTTNGQFVFLAIAQAAMIGILWLVMRSKATPAAVGFTRRPVWKDAGLALLAALAYFITLLLVSSLCSSLFGVNVDQKQEIGFDNVSGVLDMVLIFVSLVILPPLVEETLFRGVLFGGLRKRLNFVWAALVTSAMFAIPHLLEGSDGILWIAGIDTFVLSLFLCHLRERTGSLWSSVMLHMLKNGVAFLALFVFGTR